MKLTNTDSYIKEGIKLTKVIDQGYSHMFAFKAPTYDYKTVFDLEEAVRLTGEGWWIVNQNSLMQNIALNLYRDLKKK